jgi:uncharacterized protein YaaR (DUF327 family)
MMRFGTLRKFQLLKQSRSIILKKEPRHIDEITKDVDGKKRKILLKLMMQNAVLERLALLLHNREIQGLILSLYSDILRLSYPSFPLGKHWYGV